MNHSSPHAKGPENPQISLALGEIIGKKEEGIAVFKGIPYAKAPIGDLRWQPPQKMQAWTEAKACQEFGPVCPQAEYPQTSIYRISPREQSEDCLYLNVWTPDLDPEEKLPVMLWIHGGNLNRGSACLPHYDGLNLAKEGLVLVTINYRVGVFGFMAHPLLSEESEQGVSGNYGLLDQIAALEWVQENIEAFGGDKNRITIFGESAGSWSVNTLMASPLATGLFHRAIGQSGASFYGNRQLKEKQGRKISAEEMGQKLMQASGAKSLEEMRALSVEELLEVSFDPKLAFAAEFIVDGWALPKTVKEIFEEKSQHAVPMIIGSNDREWSGFVDRKSLPKNLEDYRKKIEKRFPEKWELFNNAYPAKEDEDILMSHMTHFGDYIFSLQVRRWARAAVNAGQEVYLYYFRREPNSRQKAFLGAFHAAEIPYVFQNLAKVPNSNMYEGLDYELSQQMSRYWVDFAKGEFEKHAGSWKAFQIGEEAYMDFGDEVFLGERLHEERLDILEELLEG